MSLLKEQLELTKTRRKELRKLINELEMSKSKLNELNNFIENKDKIIYEQIKNSGIKLQELILELNKISIVGISNRSLLKNEFFQLKLLTQSFINEVKGKENINRSNMFKILKIENVEETMKILDRINAQILKVKN